ncbi:MAG TPA: hypothetical protein VJS92_00340 [Candidatus Polarisedimenticolaceae bacterium]|nr:hypothetical protein [Candidatus Polarisedimenticolaceae bacterium]
MRRGPDLLPEAPAAATTGRYSARYEPHEGPVRRFRLLLFAAPPDRLHAEVLSPVGTTALVVDGGGGQLAVTVPGERTAYVGPERPEALERLLGLPLTLQGAVTALLEGPPSSSTAVQREGGPRGTLPERLELRGSAGRLALRLQQRRAIPADRAAELGTGRPPAGVERLPLEAWLERAAP